MALRREQKSEIPCQVIELPVQAVMFGTKLANNGEVLAGALSQGQSDESKIIPWEHYPKGWMTRNDWSHC